LIIIPFKGLSDIPFDLLPSSESGKLAINDFAISYNYSTKLWMQNFSETESLEFNLLAIAPVFDNKIKIDLTEFSDFTADSLDNLEFAYRSGIIKPLPFSLAEVSSLQKTFNKKKINNRILVQENATVENFNKYAAESSIIHIATHGTSSKSNPYKTGLFFYIPENESANNNFLSVYDLSFIDLKSDLVVLSACKTGSGQLATGEGVIALPRAFVNSGATNVLASYWLINDERSKFLMDSFYSHLLNGNDYSTSLQKAKLDCIENGFSELDWAGFFIVGE
jgi:CHAT domain-containing protein